MRFDCDRMALRHTFTNIQSIVAKILCVTVTRASHSAHIDYFFIKFR